MTERHERLVAVIRTSDREELRITRGEFKTQLREWFAAADGSMRPGKDGVSVRSELVRELIEGLRKAAGIEATPQ